MTCCRGQWERVWIPPAIWLDFWARLLAAGIRVSLAFLLSRESVTKQERACRYPSCSLVCASSSGGLEIKHNSRGCDVQPVDISGHDRRALPSGIVSWCSHRRSLTAAATWGPLSSGSFLAHHRSCRSRRVLPCPHCWLLWLLVLN